MPRTARGLLHGIGMTAALVLAAGCAMEGLDEVGSSGHEVQTTQPNSQPVHNENGYAASYSTQGAIDLESAFLTPQGTNGRSCGTCHFPEDGWTIAAATVQQAWADTGGTHPLFVNNRDADVRDGPSTIDNFTMLLQGKFTRRQSPRADAEFELIAVDDPFGVSTLSSIWFFRRSMPTTNFRNHVVSWDGANIVGTSLEDGLKRQARSNITGAQQGAPASEETIQEIVDFEMAMSHAQLQVEGAGRLDEDGARGGPENLSTEGLVSGPFDLYDAWADSDNPRRRAIYRGQQLFNSTNAGNGRSCRGCHNAKNDGQNVAGNFQNTGASDVQWAKPDMAIFTLRHKVTGEIKQTTDPGRGFRTGRWDQIGAFKSPSLRGLSARGEYYHNGVASSLEEVVAFYEQSLGFDFTPEEEFDLVAFLGAL